MPLTDDSLAEIFTSAMHIITMQTTCTAIFLLSFSLSYFPHCLALLSLAIAILFFLLIFGFLPGSSHFNPAKTSIAHGYCLILLLSFLFLVIFLDKKEDDL